VIGCHKLGLFHQGWSVRWRGQGLIILYLHLHYRQEQNYQLILSMTTCIYSTVLFTKKRLMAHNSSVLSIDTI
jgi:hypothetical protein